jgi:hypothetical protein
VSFGGTDVSGFRVPLFPKKTTLLRVVETILHITKEKSLKKNITVKFSYK